MDIIIALILTPIFAYAIYRNIGDNVLWEEWKSEVHDKNS